MSLPGLILALVLAAEAPPGPAPEAPAFKPPRSAAEIEALHASLRSPDVKTRRGACEAIMEVDLPERDLYLGRLHAHSYDRWAEKQRLELSAAGIELPSPSGWFSIPKLKQGEKAPWDADLLEALLARSVPGDAGRQQAYVLALETLCVLRGLSRLRDLGVAEPVLKFAFHPYGIAFRWEVFRTLRGLGGYAVPALLPISRIEVEDWKKERERYLLGQLAFHLLTTMDEANPRQAIGHADKELRLLLLAAYGKYREAEAIEAVLGQTDHDDPDIRAAARAALREYFEGRPPKAKVKKLKLPGGQESPYYQKINLTYRERASHEIRRLLEELTGGRYDRGIPGRELLQALFDVQDRRRATRWNRRFEEALERHRAGALDEALAITDEILRHAPTFPSRHLIAPLLRRQAERLMLAGDLAAAAHALRRSALLLRLPEGEAQRRVTLADAAYLDALLAEARGRRAEAVELHDRALALWPEHLGARVALTHLAPNPEPEPLLPLTIVLLCGLGLPGLLLLGATLFRPRRA